MTPERCEEIVRLAKEHSLKGPLRGFAWQDNIRDFLTEDEKNYVRSVWDKMSGSSCWWDAFTKIRQGRA